MALVYQNEQASKIRGTLNTIFTIGTPISLIGLWWAGQRPNASSERGPEVWPATLPTDSRHSSVNPRGTGGLLEI